MTKKEEQPEYLSAGEKARLIPVVSETSKEDRASSILLAVLASVHEYAEVMFKSIGKRIGERSKIETYTQVAFKSKTDEDQLRPDGLIIIKTGRSEWRALVEAKIGDEKLDAEQIKKYLALAKQHNIDAVITISNQLSALRSHHPIAFSKQELKRVELYHFSWMSILVEAILLRSSGGVKDKSQQYILDEMCRYYEHDKTGVSSFTNMNKEWKDVVSSVRTESALSSKDVENTVISWHQEARDICLILSCKIEARVSLHLSKKHKESPQERIKDDCNLLASDKKLVCNLDIPNAASKLAVTANLNTRSVNCCMTLEAPKDKQRSSARLNWLLRQLKRAGAREDIFITANIKGRGNSPTKSLKEIIDNENCILKNDGNDVMPQSFDVYMSRDLAGKFSSRSNFIKALEDTTIEFYESVGQYLKAWSPSAPKVKKEVSEDIEDVAAASSETEE